MSEGGTVMARPSQCPVCGCFEVCLYPNEIRCAEHQDAPSKFFEALAQADDRIAAAELSLADADDAAETIGLLLEENAGLRCRIQELTAERDAAVTEREHWRGVAHRWMTRVGR